VTVEAFQRRPHLRRRRVCRRTKGARAMGGIAVWIRQDRRAAGALYRCTAIHMMHGCTAVSYMQRLGTICAMSAIGVSSVHSDCSCTALASSRSGCRRINSTAAFAGFRCCAPPPPQLFGTGVVKASTFSRGSPLAWRACLMKAVVKPSGAPVRFAHSRTMTRTAASSRSYRAGMHFGDKG
jgi:hypothetical protein